MAHGEMANGEMTLVAKLRDLARTQPQMEAFVSYDEAMVRSSFTTEEFYSLCARFAYILKQDGVLPGDYVVTTVPLSLESTIITYGTLFAGAVPANLEITFTDGEGLLQCMEKLKNRHLIVQDEPWSEVLKFCKSTFEVSFYPSALMAGMTSSRLPCLERLMLVKRSGGRDRSFIELLRASRDEYVYDRITPESVGWFSFTTGTEVDIIRMCEYTHSAIIHGCRLHHEMKKINCRNRLYANPYFWVSSMPFDTLYGKTRVMPDKWRMFKDYPLMLVKIILTEGVEQADLQPLDIKKMLEVLDEHTGGEPLLHVLECGGMPITKSHMEALRPIARNFALLYGSHESPLTTMNLISAQDIDQMEDYDNGPLGPGVQMKILDPQGNEVPPGEKGRVLIKSPALFRGYPNEQLRTAAKFNKEHWFMTYDQARLDPVTKHVFIGGRIDALILHGQYMLFPSWLEAMVAPHPAVKEVVCVPVRDTVLFHGIGICVIKHDKASLTKEQVTQMILSTVVTGKEFLIEPKIVAFFDSFPTTPDGSVDRPKLSDKLAEMCENGSD